MLAKPLLEVCCHDQLQSANVVISLIPNGGAELEGQNMMPIFTVQMSTGQLEKCSPYLFEHCKQGENLVCEPQTEIKLPGFASLLRACPIAQSPPLQCTALADGRHLKRDNHQPKCISNATDQNA
jgi:hypothetical protein